MLRFKVIVFLAILTLSSAQETERKIPLTTLEQLIASLDSVKESLANEGEWNAQLRLTRLERDDSRLLSSWEITGGKSLALDSVILQGADELNSQTIAQIVEGKIGHSANNNSLIKLDKSVVAFSFLNKAGDPYYARSSENRLSAVIPVETDFSHTIVAAAGLQPSPDGKSQITGDIQIGLENPFGSATISRLWWNRKDEKSQKIFISYEDPFLWRFRVGGYLSFLHILQDGLYIRQESAVSVAVPRSRFGKWSFGGSEETVTITDEGDSLGLAGHTIRSLTVQGEWDRRDSRKNPTKGQWLKFHFGLGDFVSDGSAETISFDVKGESEILIPIMDRLTLSLATDGGYFGLASGAVPLSKKLRYGGASSLRGYDEEQFESVWVVINQLEMRYRANRDNYFYTFIDGSFDDEKRTPASIGIGLTQKTPMGILQLDYAVGKDDSPKEGKIHIRIINRF